jgi:catechol 2,3-dioxygenase-like lactoylglutathione lyase family enzyme
MSGFKIIGTNHTSFTVSDMDRTLAFFCDVLGFDLLNRGRRDPDFISRVVAIPGADIEVAYIQGPGHRLELIQYHGPDGRRQVESRPCDAGFAHVAFDVDDIDAAIAASEAVGVHPLGPPQDLDRGPNKGGRVVYTRDPDGITVEFIQPPKR